MPTSAFLIDSCVTKAEFCEHGKAFKKFKINERVSLQKFKYKIKARTNT